jgi:S-disulfanyl-L-cysteine oxidoreductase SoxD
MKSKILLITALLVCGAARDGLAQTDSTSVGQAERGQATFRSVCANCHSTSQFSGAAFVKKWVGRSAFDIFEQIRTTMPQDNPGGLPREQYLSVVAYLLKLNNSLGGDGPLADDADHLKKLIITAPAPIK